MAYKGEREEKPGFTLLHAIVRLSIDTYCCTANAPKTMRLTICRKMQDETDALVDLIYAANNLNLFDCFDEREKTLDALNNHLGMYKRRLEVATGCRCLSLGDQKVLIMQTGEIDNKLQALKKSDKRRIEQYIKTGERK